MITVPETAVDYTLYGDSVYLITEKKDARTARPALARCAPSCRPAAGSTARAVITQGLKAGDRVVAVGQLKLQSGAPVAISTDPPPQIPAQPPLHWIRWTGAMPAAGHVLETEESRAPLMAFTDIFIKRPVLSLVVSLLILLIGLRAATALPIRQYPKLSNTVITVTTVYPGASPDLMQGFITTPIEQAVASAEGVDYMTSSSAQGTSDDLGLHQAQLRSEPGAHRGAGRRSTRSNI